MIRKVLLPRRKKHDSKTPRRSKKTIQKLLENDLIRRVSYEEYREKVRDVYAGPQGALECGTAKV